MSNSNDSDNKQSVRRKWIWRFSIGCLSLLILIIVLSLLGYYILTEKLCPDFDDLGFHEKVEAQYIEVNETIGTPTFYLGQHVKILSDSKSDIAIMAQLAEIYGKIEGNVYFCGQLLTIQPIANIEGNLDVKAQLINMYGEVNGEITGSYETLDEGIEDNN